MPGDERHGEDTAFAAPLGEVAPIVSEEGPDVSEAASEVPEAAPEVSEAMADISEATPAPVPLTEEEEGYLQQLQRLQAEFSNYRKRVSRERGEWEAHAKGELVTLLIPILDDLGRAREAHAGNPPSAEAEGLLLILSRLQDTLASAGLEIQETSPGIHFDPHHHEAVSCEPSVDHPEGEIIGTVQPGYLFRGQLLRPARVRVSQGAPVAEP